MEFTFAMDKTLSLRLFLSLGLFLALTFPAQAQTAVDSSFEQHLWAAAPQPHWEKLKTLYVSTDSPHASDANAGTLLSPLKTIQQAVNRAKPGTDISIAPGIYRETIQMRRVNSGTAEAPIVLESQRPGTVILSGSDRWGNWQPEASPGVYSHAWPYHWGVSADPFAGAAPMQPLGRRAEMVFVNGGWYRQVLSRSQMVPQTFWVTEETGMIYLQTPAALSIRQAQVEVAIRRQAIDMGSVWGGLDTPHDWPSYYVLRGLTVQHYTGQGEFSLPAVAAYGSHFLLENCDISWNNSTGLSLRGTDIVVRHCRLEHNGYSGISVPPTPVPAVKDVLLADDVTAENNWRGALGDFYGYAVAGMKMMTSVNVILRGFISRDNASAGVWLDKDNRNYLIEDSQFLRNRDPGLWLEISQGPFLVRRCVFASNESGVRISNSAQITLSHDIFYANKAQIDEWSPALNRAGFYDSGLILSSNVVVCADNTQALWRRPDYPNTLQTLTSSGNLWWRPDGAGWEVGSADLDFSQWLAATRQDTSSLMVDPRLRAPQSGDFTPRVSSPLLRKAAWGTRAVVFVLPPGGLADKETQVYLNGVGAPGPIHYTVDGMAPTLASPVYAGPFLLPDGGKVSAKVFGPASADNPAATVNFIGGAPPVPDISISSLLPTKNVVGWGGYAHTNLSIQGQPLHVDGIPFSDGVGAHAPSELIYTIPADVARFVADVGLDDEVLGQDAQPSVIFKVYADNTLLFQTATMTPGQIGFVNVALPSGAKTIRLVVTLGGSSQEWDHADWVRAGFVNRP